MLYLRAARTFIEACDAEGIPVLPVKGIVSAYTLYGDPAERPLGDVDVRVTAGDMRRIARLCRKRRWPLLQRMRAYANLVTDVDGVAVDVEAHVGPPGLCALEVRNMLARSTITDALGFRCLVPDFTDHAVLLLVNAFKDKLFNTLDWAVRDLEHLTQHDHFDAAALVERLRESDCVTIGWLTADWLVQHRRASSWTTVRNALGPPKRIRYVAAFKAALERDPNGLATRILARNAADTPSRRLKAMAYMAMWQTEVHISQLGPTPFVRARPPARTPMKD